MLASLIIRAGVLLSFAKHVKWIAAATVLYSAAALAQQAQPQAPQQQALTWEKMPRMQLEQQYAGPLKDTVLQRWRDPQSGFTCYVYLPFTVAHTPQSGGGYVQYGPNMIGSISCVQPEKGPVASAPAAKSSPKSSPPAAKRAPPPLEPEPKP
jgi:hypothetical protein